MGSDLKHSSLVDMVNYQKESVVSKTLIEKNTGQLHYLHLIKVRD